MTQPDYIATNGARVSIEGLANDLQSSWDTRNDTFDPITLDVIQEPEPMRAIQNASSFIYAIDPEHMELLKELYKANHKGRSLLSYAFTFVKRRWEK